MLPLQADGDMKSILSILRRYQTIVGISFQVQISSNGSPLLRNMSEIVRGEKRMKGERVLTVTQHRGTKLAGESIPQWNERKVMPDLTIGLLAECQRCPSIVKATFLCILDFFLNAEKLNFI